jgi:hypothetical protein
VDGGESLKTSHAPEPEYRPFPSSERQVRILRSFVHPTTGLLPVVCSKLLQSGTVGPKSFRHDNLGLTAFAHCLLQLPEPNAEASIVYRTDLSDPRKYSTVI